MNKTEFQFLEQANTKSERAWHILFKWVMGGFSISAVLNTVLSIFACLKKTGEFNAEYLYHPDRSMYVEISIRPKEAFTNIVFVCIFCLYQFAMESVNQTRVFW